MSEIYGRSRVLQFANLFYLGIVHSSPRTVHFVISGQLVWNLACGFAQNEGQFIAFRLLAGLGGSGPLAVRRPTPYFFHLPTYGIRSVEACLEMFGTQNREGKLSPSTPLPPFLDQFLDQYAAHGVHLLASLPLISLFLSVCQDRGTVHVALGRKSTLSFSTAR
jgi:hypothetical protein